MSSYRDLEYPCSEFNEEKMKFPVNLFRFSRFLWTARPVWGSVSWKYWLRPKSMRLIVDPVF
jgi:hypothetical protein